MNTDVIFHSSIVIFSTSIRFIATLLEYRRPNSDTEVSFIVIRRLVDNLMALLNV